MIVYQIPKTLINFWYLLDISKNFEVKFIRSKKFIDSGENESKGISFIMAKRFYSK